MNSAYCDIIRTHCKPLVPRPTNLRPRLRVFENVRGVLFDVYGTMMISDSGDIGLESKIDRSTAVDEVIELFELELSCDAKQLVKRFDSTIVAAHQSANQNGIDYPEVNIATIWEQTIEQVLQSKLPEINFDRFALEFEIRINKTWPMPELVSTIQSLKQHELPLGIVSNAQFFTPLLFPALVGKSLPELGFDPNLSFFSFEHLQAKPGEHLYALAREKLASNGLPAEDILYVGNDMLNDVAAAQRCGFLTALFAGDQRSLRLRENDDRVRGIHPDIVLTELSQILECLAICLPASTE